MATTTRATKAIAGAAVLGLLTTVLLAWTAGALSPVPDAMDQTRSQGLSPQEWWLLGKTNKPAGVRYVSCVMIRASQYKPSNSLVGTPAWATLPTPPTLNAWPNDHYEIADGGGWPWVALSFRFSGSGTGAATTGNVHGGIALPPRSTGAWYDPRALPLTPHWPGLIGDTLVFAAAWAALFYIVRALRAHRRRKRGLCPGCGYDLRATSTQCPECGLVTAAAAP